MKRYKVFFDKEEVNRHGGPDLYVLAEDFNEAVKKLSKHAGNPDITSIILDKDYIETIE